MRRFRPAIMVMALCLLLSRAAWAHWADLAAADITCQGGQVDISLTFPTGLLSIADDDRNGRLDEQEVARHQDELRSRLAESIVITDALGRRAALLAVEAVDTPAGRGAPSSTHSTLHMRYRLETAVGNLRMRYSLFLTGVPTARCVATVESGSGFSTVVFTPQQNEQSLGGAVAGRGSLQQALSGMAPGVQALLFAFVLGALHAFSPGHGKTIVGAYLVGSRGTVGHAVLLGAVVTFTHTISVILLGVFCLYAFQHAVPEQLYPWLGCASGLLISAMGVYLLRTRGRQKEHEVAHHQHETGSAPFKSPLARQQAPSSGGLTVVGVEDGSGGHFHGGRYHTHEIPQKITLLGLLTLGVSGGIVPCPDALVVLLSAIALKKILLGLFILVAFSMGIASVLMGIGIGMVCAGKALAKYYPSRLLLNRVTTFSYCAITVLGLVVAVQSLIQR